MSAIDDEILKGAEDDAREVAYIRERLPQELKERFSDDELYYILDVTIDYYTNSHVFDQTPDKEGYINVDLDAVTDYVVKQAKKEGMGEFKADEVFFVVQADMDFSEEEDSTEEEG